MRLFATILSLFFLQSIIGQCVITDELRDAAAGISFTCGDSFEYQGYSYQTVLVGDQCWFAENLRSENYSNDDAIDANLSNDSWANTTSGAVATYGGSWPWCVNYAEDFNACSDPSAALTAYGRYYNWYAVNDSRGLCPSGWHVPTDNEWMTMEVSLGLTEVEANAWEWRGTNEGSEMKSTSGWSAGGNGTNTSGLNSLPAGARNGFGAYDYAGYFGFWWTASDLGGGTAYFRQLARDNDAVYRHVAGYRDGYSVRCIKD